MIVILIIFYLQTSKLKPVPSKKVITDTTFPNHRHVPVKNHIQ